MARELAFTPARTEFPASDKAWHDKMVELAERMLDPSAGSELALRNSKGQALRKQLPKAKTPHVWADSSLPTASSLRLTAYGQSLTPIASVPLSSQLTPLFVSSRIQP
jgi:hypothetical protein